MAKQPHVPFRELAEIERLVTGFDDCTLTCDQWTHAAHLTVGLWYASRFPPDEALDRVRAGIQRYNAVCLAKDAPGYHETITRFYLWLIGKYLDAVVDRSNWVAITNGLIDHAAAKENHPLTYYNADRLMSPEARAGWLPPDLRALD